MRQYIAQQRFSLWMLVASLISSAVMMHPGFAALIAITLNSILLFLLRTFAMWEGQSQSK